MEFKPDGFNDRTVRTVAVKAKILDAPLRPVPYRRDGRMWQPRHICITWVRTRKGDGPWSEWSTSWESATIVGPHIRKDGSDANVTATARFVKADDPEFGEWIVASRPGED